MKLAKFCMVGGAASYAGLYYLFPLLRKDSQELVSAGKRLFRISSTAAKIGYNYLGGVTSQKHEVNS